MKPLFEDIPQELVDVMNAIQFSAIAPDKQAVLLQQLQTWVEQELVAKGHIRVRTRQNNPIGKFRLRPNIPDAAFDLLNRYDYGKPSLVTRVALRSKALEYLRSIGIPLHKEYKQKNLATA